ncbi:ubiquinone biosynthesis protein, putative [Talaromyces stipitatus ATCC 10500]|uniref:Ubiquinone biosynthesis protein, putative n=1 Tax=Talaromyces stipitatus (strain ATCC 10500 / CBS 375.48 / QM 6759 / NRRL 1006) TaxID=441959 RepID=B8LTT2_TALSN|nr:ubiquinone biosynthesis protein, putative [Talaromyces stipitatus ATCC 10500]EED23674.1 ubiquinone biosynthesis protein, putative [Talaromyces stipitatus ATCC 10500]
MRSALPRPITTAFRSPTSLPRTRNTAWSPFCSRCWTNERAYQTSIQRSFRSTPSQRLDAAQLKNGSSSNGSKRSSRRRTAIRFAAAGGTVGVAVIGFWDDIKHGYAAAERSARVATTLAICINDYRTTLNQTSGTPKEQEELLKACHKRCAERTLVVLEKNGSIFIKLGQHLSSMGYLLPLEWTTTFIPLQDKCPVSSFESVQKMFLADTGKRIDEVFSEFSPTPIGAASLAQVHVATLRETGQKVAVKIQHPALAEWVPLDLALTRFTFSTLKRFFPEYDLEWLSNEMDLSLPMELDFRHEAENAMRTKEYFKRHSDAPLVIPQVMSAEKRILVMDFISGARPDDLEFLDKSGIDRDEVSAAFAHIFNEMIFGDNAPLHCDPHGGNIAIRKNDSRRKPNFDIILYDHGLYRDIPQDLRRSYAKLWLSVIEGDEKKMRKYAYEVAGVTDELFPIFASAITGRDFTVISQNKIVSSRDSEQEKSNVTSALSHGLLQQLVDMLGRVPRIILLILKTNDLTRSLDENLHTRQGPVRTFLILARYATRTVFEEQMEFVSQNGSLLRPSNLFRFLSAFTAYVRVELKLLAYEKWLSVKSTFGIVA